MSYNDGGDFPQSGGIRKPPRDKSTQPFDGDNNVDQRKWKNPGLGQKPAPQANRNAPPDTDSDPIFSRPSRSNSPVAGHPGIHHLDGEGTQYAFSIDRGLHQRPEGARQHEHAADAQAEELASATTADIARHKYNGDQQTGNQHKAWGAAADLSKGSMTRKGQGKPASNKLEDCGGY